jgi:hypothetical protein
MSLDYMVAGDYGQIIVLTVLDCDTSAAADISGYSTSIQVVLKDPSLNEETKTALFVTDGSDGKVKYTVTTGVIDERGSWAIRAIVKSGTAQLSSDWAQFAVLD